MKTEKKKPWYSRWWAITIFIFIVLGFIGNLGETPKQDSTHEIETGEFNLGLITDSLNKIYHSLYFFKTPNIPNQFLSAVQISLHLKRVGIHIETAATK